MYVQTFKITIAIIATVMVVPLITFLSIGLYGDESNSDFCRDAGYSYAGNYKAEAGYIACCRTIKEYKDHLRINATEECKSFVCEKWWCM